MSKTFECLKCGEEIRQATPTRLLQERSTVCQCGQIHHVKTMATMRVDKNGTPLIVDWTIMKVSALTPA